MMKQTILLILTCSCLNILLAQEMEFNISPVIVNGVTADDFEGVGHATVKNTANTQRDFRWDLTVVDKDAVWDIALCDRNICHDTSIVSEQFFLEADSSGRMDVHAYTNFRDGFAVVEVVVTDIDDENLQVSNIYYFNADPTGTQETFYQTIKIYPNPSNGLFSVKGEKGIARVEVFSLIGNKVKNFTYGDSQWYDISDLPHGTYMVRLVDRSGQQLVTKLMNKL